MDLKAVGARITSERERAGLSQRELAERAELSQPTLHRMERGSRATASVAELDRIARVLEIPLRLLTQGSPVHDRLQVAARVEAGSEADRDRAVHAVGDMLALDDRLDGFDIAPFPPKAGPRRGDFAARMHERSGGEQPEEQGRSLADSVRAFFGLGGNPIPDLAEFAEFALGLDTATLELPKTVSGLTAVDPARRITLVVVNAEETRERQRFTLAHDIAHVLLEDDVPTHHHTCARTPAERRCDAFARHLLAPFGGIRQCLGLDEQGHPNSACSSPVAKDLRGFAMLARHFGISLTPVLIQLRQLGLISEQDQQRLTGSTGRELAWRFGWGPQYDDEARTARQPRPPRRILERAVEAYQAGRIGVRSIAALDGADVRETEAALEAAGIAPPQPPAPKRADLGALLARRGEGAGIE